MRWITRIGILGVVISVAQLIKFYLENKTIVIVDKEDISFEEDEPVNPIKDSIVNLKPEDYNHAMDLRGAPTHVCACGCDIWNLKVTFDDNQISQYFLDMECVNCGSVATAPTPINQENTE